MSSLNGPLDVGIRLVFYLEAAFPSRFDVNQLVLADHLLTHSADGGGPPSLHPPMAVREGELGLKRIVIHEALKLMSTFDLVEASHDEDGILFGATDRAYGFVRLFESSHSKSLAGVSKWLSKELRTESTDESVKRMQLLIAGWPLSLSLALPSGEEGPYRESN